MGQKSEFDDDGFLANFFRREDAVPMPQSMSRLLMIVGGVAVLAAVVAITWATWPKGGAGSDGDQVPVITADHDAYKIKPEEPGGMAVPNKDSTIFETLQAAQNGDGQVESLLEDAEKPMDKDNLIDETPAPAPEPEMAMTAPAEEKVSSVPVPEKKLEVATEQPKKADAKSVIAELKSEVAPKTGSGTSYVQLAAVKSDADAKAKWKALQSKYASLSGLSLRVQKTDVAGKGTFYRVQGGPLSADSAKDVCAKIKAAKGDCLVAK